MCEKYIYIRKAKLPFGKAHIIIACGRTTGTVTHWFRGYIKPIRIQRYPTKKLRANWQGFVEACTIYFIRMDLKEDAAHKICHLH